MQLYRDPLLKSSNLGGDRYWEEDHHKTCNNILGCPPSFLVGNPNLNLHFHYYWEGGQPKLYTDTYMLILILMYTHRDQPGTQQLAFFRWNRCKRFRGSQRKILHCPRMPGSAQGLGAEGKCRAKRIQIWPDGRNLGAVSK